MAYNLHDLKITGIELTEVLSCKINGQIGEHGSLELCGYPGQEEKLLFEIPDHQPIEVILENAEGKTTLFSGIISELSYSAAAQMNVVTILAKTSSCLMDIDKHSRTFQNTGMKYSELIAQVLEAYPGSSFSYAPADQEIGKLIVQYEETDWQFLMRVMSMLGTSITPDSQQAGIRLYAGIPALFEVDFTGRLLKIEKDMDSYYSLQSAGYQVYAVDFTRYEVSSEALLRIFDPVKVSGQSFVVYSFTCQFDSQEMTGIYKLQTAAGLLALPIYPMHMIGIALGGTVTGVAGDKIQAALAIDQGTASVPEYWFTYSTISASPDGTGWYCMPEIGDEVRIYFPSKHESEAIALSAVSNYSSPGGGQTDRMGNPDSRYLRTKAGQELALAPDQLKLSCSDGVSSVTISNDGKVSISAQNGAYIMAQADVKLHAAEKLSIHSQDEILIQSLSGGGTKISGDIIEIYGTEVTFE